MITGLELLNEVNDRLGWPQIETLEGSSDPTSEQRKLINLLNRVLRSLDAGADWPLLREEGDLIVTPAETGSAKFFTANGDDTIINMDSTIGFDVSYKERAIQIGSHNTVYRIKKVVTTRTVDLNRIWLGDDDAGLTDEQTYQIVQDRYALPTDFARPNGKWSSFFSPYGIKYVDPEKFLQVRRDRGNSILIGEPEIFTVWGLAPDGNSRMIHFDPWPDNQYMYTYTYQKIHPEILYDNDRILYPHTHIGMIIEAVLYLANRDYENAEKMDLLLRDFVMEFNKQRGQPELTEARMRLSPSGEHRQLERMKWLRGTRKIDWGDYFDRSDKVGFF
ncbi:MAG: hypothetical protein AMJ65_01610 [Phycisphaerae bacterium SG8_4]|nr:MAG: hypothetical protein AMJ65_01610 [Phycisphaerae bacterium SG8_4]